MVGAQDRITLKVNFRFPEVSDDHSLEFQFLGEDNLYNQNNEGLRGDSRQRASEAVFEAASKYIDNTGNWKEPHLSKNEGGKSNQGGLDQANIVLYTNINTSQYGVESEQISKSSFAKVLGSWTIPAGFPGLATSPLFGIAGKFKQDGAINVIFVTGTEGATAATPQGFDNVLFIASGANSDVLAHELGHCLGLQHTQDDRRSSAPIETKARINNPKSLFAPGTDNLNYLIDQQNLMCEGNRQAYPPVTYLTDTQCWKIWNAAKSHKARILGPNNKDFSPD